MGRVFEKDRFRPERPCLVERARVAEVVGASEVLPAAVHAARAEKLLCPDEAERHPEVRAEKVLPPLAAGEGKVGDLRAHPA